MKTLTRIICVALIICSAQAAADPITITFDDVLGNLTGSLIDDGYYGFDWNFAAIDPVANGEPFATSGYTNGLVSGNFVGFLLYGSSSIARNSSFDFVSAYLTAAWNDNVRVLVSGFFDNVLAYQQILFVDSASPALYQFDFLGVDKVSFSTSGGVNAGYGGNGANVAVDNLVVNVPEPGTLALFAIGLLGIGLTRKRSA